MTGSYRKGNAHLGKAFGDPYCFIRIRGSFIKCIYVLINRFVLLPTALIQFFPHVLGVSMPLKFRQGKPLHDPCCQKPEVSDAEWRKGVMQEADFLLGNDK